MTPKKKTFRFLALVLMTALLCISISPVLAKLPTPNPSTSPTISSALQQGKTLYDSGQFAQAVQILQQAAQNYRQQGDTKRLAATLSNLSLAYQQLGAWNQAKQAITESLNLLKSIDDRIILAQTLDIQGRLQLAMGQPEDALQTWQQAGDIYSKANDQNGVVRSQINQAQALISSGFYRRAEATLLQVNQTLRSQSDSLEKAVMLRSLGDVLQLVGKLQQSHIVLEESLAVAKRLKSPNYIAASLFSLGNNARDRQQTQQAINFYQQTVKETSSPLLKVQAQLNLLSLLIEEQKPTAALTLVPQIQSQLDQLPPSRASVYAQINFAQNLVKLGDEKENSPHHLLSPAQILAQAVQQARSLNDQRSLAYALGTLGSLYEHTRQWSEAQKLTEQALLLAQSSNAPDIAYKWQWQLGRLLKVQGDIPRAIAAYDLAVQTLESIRNDLVAVNREVQFSFRDSVEPVYRESVQLLLDTQQIQPEEKTLEKARQRIEALQIAELDNFFREACLQGQRILLDKVVDKENPTAAILYPIILPDELQVIVKIPKQPLRHYSTQISQTEVEQIVSQLRQNLVNPAAIKATRTQSQQVYNWLIKPIESQLSASGVNTLVFVLDGALRNLPMSSLYNGQQYLVEKYATALSVGLQLLDPKPLQRQQLQALTAGLTQPPQAYSDFAPLPAIRTEIELISEAGISTTNLLDRQFTSKELKKKVNTTPFNVVHLATHGQFSSRADQTFILAADGPINVTQFDSILRNRDNIRPEALQLLVLSACQTAVGDKRAALGLAGAAVRAGARSTIASLWQIDDESTAQFVGAFYRELKEAKITKAEALRRAQLQLLKHPNYNAPGFWSAYVLIGNWL
ncbi:MULTISPECIES: CHAT domain-containing protein [Fischerella]|uniref:CHAT domain-containing protein n=1 Tax=Fischerella TaxID=1190 RepID=UPI00037CA339|nr:MULTISPECIES: CHAT domain-containing protein [Fischerella]MBD2433110.1 CHAT domain-containing protein [Fischerella sp. FACHB-380]